MGDRQWRGAAAAGTELAGPVPEFRRAGGDRAGPGGRGVDPRRLPVVWGVARRRFLASCGRNAAAPGRYRATSAHAAAWVRASRPKPAKLATNLVLRELVEQYLQKKYSPEQIAGRLRVQFPDDPEMWVSTETIYQSLYVQSRGALRRELTKCLRTGRRQSAA